MILRSNPSVKFPTSTTGSFDGIAVINAPIKLAFDTSRQKSERSVESRELIITVNFTASMVHCRWTICDIIMRKDCCNSLFLNFAIIKE